MISKLFIALLFLALTSSVNAAAIPRFNEKQSEPPLARALGPGFGPGFGPGPVLPPPGGFGSFGPGDGFGSVPPPISTSVSGGSGSDSPSSSANPPSASDPAIPRLGSGAIPNGGFGNVGPAIPPGTNF